MKKELKADPTLLAPCGVNCGTCLGYLRDKNTCKGCWSNDNEKRHYCAVCKIKNCEYLIKSGSRICFGCEKYPCYRLKQLAKRYITNYNSDLLENLSMAHSLGISEFMELEAEKWKCPTCGGTVCVHRGGCLECKK